MRSVCVFRNSMRPDASATSIASGAASSTDQAASAATEFAARISILPATHIGTARAVPGHGVCGSVQLLQKLQPGAVRRRSCASAATVPGGGAWHAPCSRERMDLTIQPRELRSPGQQALEVVERKGIGHPDTICDAVAEHVSQRLCAYYLERFGAIQHHNVDKVLLCAGASRASFGGGEVL